MSWSEVTLTEVGENLLAKMLNGGRLTFTKVILGDSIVSGELLCKQTEIASPINAPALIAGKEQAEKGNGTIINIQIRNDGIEEATRMRQIGLYATTEQDDEVLLGILQDEIGEEIPAYADFPQFELSLGVLIAVSRTNQIDVVVSSNVYAHQVDLKALADKVDESSSTTAAEISKHNTDKNAHAELFAAMSRDAQAVNTKEEVSESGTAVVRYPTFVDSNNAKAMAEAVYTNNAFKFQVKRGIADNSTSGYAQLKVGNNISNETEGHMKGQLVFYCGEHQYHTILEQNSGQTSNQINYLPAKAGTLALEATPTAFSVQSAEWSEKAVAFVGCKYSAEIMDENVTAADFPDIYFDENSLEAAAEAAITAAAANGAVTLYAKTLPESEISGHYFIRKGVLQ